MKLLTPLLIPVLSFAGTFSGTVVSLEGIPVVGAVVKAGPDSVVTPAGGRFSLARTSAISRLAGKTISVTSHLTVEKGRPRISFGTMDISGRTLVSFSADARGINEAAPKGSPAAARSAVDGDTLTVYWKGKRLTVLPVSSDTTVTIRIDTAWKDDGGIPWNPRVTYGSLRDSRDGQTYRTVKIGNKTWMAENLNFEVDSSWHFQGVDSTEPAPAGGYAYSRDSLGTKYGRYYTWNAATALPDSCLGAFCPASPQGICPTGWHLPDSADWADFHPDLGEAARLLSDTTYDLALKAVKGWERISAVLVSNGYAPNTGLDLLGFRAVNSGAMFSRNPVYMNWDLGWSWWSRSESSTHGAWAHGWNTPWHLTVLSSSKNYAMAVRCLKD